MKPQNILYFLLFILYCSGPPQLSLFEENGRYGFKNQSGKVVIKPAYYIAQEFSEFGIAAVVDESGWVYINDEGENLLRPYVVDNGPDYFQENLARFVENDKVGFMNRSGDIVIPAKYFHAKSCCCSLISTF